VAKQRGNKKRRHSVSEQRQVRPQHRHKRGVIEPAHSTKTFDQNDLFIAFGLVAATLAVYTQVLNHHFIVLDDNHYIYQNAMVNRGLTLTGISWAFTTFHSANWHPITWLSHMLDCQIFGLHAGGHLLVNALIHACNTLLLFLFFRRVTGARWQSAIVALLFALHPLHVESVAWAAERKDTLSTFFGLLTLLAYSSYVAAPSLRRYAMVAVGLALGLMAKPILVTWPFVLLLLDYWPLGRFQWQGASGVKGFLKALVPLVREKLPLFCLAAASIVITLIAQSLGGAVRTLLDVPVSLRVSNAIVAYAKYLLRTVWPNDLAFYYPFPVTGVPVWQLACAIGLLTVITVFVLRQASEQPYLLVGWLWFAGTLVPMIGLVQVGSAAMADRYYYVPSIGLFMAIIFGLSDLAHFLRINRFAMGALAVGALSMLACLAAMQIGRWRDTAVLFHYTSSVAPDNRLIENYFGTSLGDSGKYIEAAAHFEKALQIKPETLISDSDILSNLGLLLMHEGKLTEALQPLNEAVRLNPGNATAHYDVGLILLKLDKPEESIPHFSAAIRLKPDWALPRENLKRAQERREVHQ
jgi:Tfp pilus assembly protein PilF